MGENGDPKDWPAAQPTPPSLAGAYSDNMMTVMVTLMAYQDWVDAHPNPALVSNYVQDGGGLYNEDKSEIEQLVQRDWRVNPAPTEIDWLAVTSPPVPMLIHGKPGFRPRRAHQDSARCRPRRRAGRESGQPLPADETRQKSTPDKTAASSIQPARWSVMFRLVASGPSR